MHSIAFNLGPVTVHWFGIMIALAFLAGLWTATRRAPRAGIPGELGCAALFLSSTTSDYITGQILAVDGGATA